MMARLNEQKNLDQLDATTALILAQSTQSLQVQFQKELFRIVNENSEFAF